MRITSSQVIKHRITDLFALDPVTVIAEDIEPGKGKITIECYGESWTAYWGAMGETKTISQFFCSCDKHYLAGKLSDIDANIVDWDGMPDKMRELVLTCRRRGDLDKDEARDIYDECCSITSEVHAHIHHDIMEKVIGDEWWREIPEIANPKYDYLCRIIEAVQGAFRQLESDKELAA